MTGRTLTPFLSQILGGHPRIYYSPMPVADWPAVKERLEIARGDYVVVVWEAGLAHLMSTMDPRTALVQAGSGAAVGFAFSTFVAHVEGGSVQLSEGWAQQVRTLARQVIEELNREAAAPPTVA